MAVKIRDTSRLRWSRLLTAGGVEFWDKPEYPSIPAANDDIRYSVARRDRIDLLANRFYESSDLWWVIAIRNDMRLVPSDLYEGQVLYIPSSRRVFNEVLRNPTRGKESK